MGQKPWLQHLFESLKTPDDYVGYLSACYDEGPETFALGICDVLKLERRTVVEYLERRSSEMSSYRMNEKLIGEIRDGKHLIFTSGQSTRQQRGKR